MKALVWQKHGRIELINKPKPALQHEFDAIVKVTASSICTSDLHIIHGFVPKAKEGIVLGHEFVGEVVELGSAITNFKIGDRVAVTCETFCGECYFCKRGYINNCVKGGWEIGCSIDGCQAEYVRVPFAQNGMTKLPDNVSDKNALFVGDVLSSGYFGAEMCEIKPDDTVVIIGCGPVGICAMQSARIFGAKTIIGLDVDEYRLNLVKENGFVDIAINPQKEDYLNIIAKLTDNRGADGVIECAGGENTFEMAWQIARPNAIVALVAMYDKPQILPLPNMYGKNLIFKTGGVDAVHCEKLVQLISEGKINTDILISKEIPLSEIEQGYFDFENKKDNCLKIAIINK